MSSPASLVTVYNLVREVGIILTVTGSISYVSWHCMKI